MYHELLAIGLNHILENQDTLYDLIEMIEDVRKKLVEKKDTIELLSAIEPLRSVALDAYGTNFRIQSSVQLCIGTMSCDEERDIFNQEDYNHYMDNYEEK